MGLIHEGLAQHGTVIITHDQTGGRGQRGKHWVTEKDKNIALSMIIDPAPLSVPDLFILSAAISVGVFDFFSRHAGEDTKLKWPNDLYWRDRKAGGILIENQIRAIPGAPAKWNWAVVGIGININQTDFPPAVINPVSLKQITGKEFDPFVLANELCQDINNVVSALDQSGFPEILNRYNRVLYKKDEKVRLKKDHRSFEAIIKSVNAYGQLVTENGTEELFDFGQVEWVI
ncbi:MAG: biotin--[acetyl-CoA-carboxylase] ligase [Terrimonas sp.]|nr:biotin--[acetyl-CoA-carboxylase] ligase [Terrimonas sp.]